jgi:hypothetical protein
VLALVALLGALIFGRKRLAGRRIGRRTPPGTAALIALALLTGGCGPTAATDDDDDSAAADDDDSAAADDDDSAAADDEPPLAGFGELSGDCDVLDDKALSGSIPALYTNILDLHEKAFDETLLSDGGQEVMADGNLGGSSLHSEAFAYEVLYRCELASLIKTEAEIDYLDPAGKKTDLLVEVEGVRLGVSVTRAFAWPPEEPYTVEQATQLLEGKLSDVLLSSANVGPEDLWTRQILSVISYTPGHTQSIETAWASIDPSIRADTLVMVTTTEGNDGYIY